MLSQSAISDGLFGFLAVEIFWRQSYCSFGTFLHSFCVYFNCWAVWGCFGQWQPSNLGIRHSLRTWEFAFFDSLLIRKPAHRISSKQFLRHRGRTLLFHTEMRLVNAFLPLGHLLLSVTTSRGQRRAGLAPWQLWRFQRVDQTERRKQR